MSDWRIQVRMLTSVAGSYTCEAGQLLSLPLDVAKAWILAGVAEAVSGAPEAAMVSAASGETAMRPRARGR